MLRIAGILLLFGMLPQASTTFDLATDFSFQNSPHSVWQVRLLRDASLDPSQFRADEYADPSAPVGFWHPKCESWAWARMVSLCRLQQLEKSQFGSSNGRAVRPGEVAMEATFRVRRPQVVDDPGQLSFAWRRASHASLEFLLYGFAEFVHVHVMPLCRS